LSTYLQIVNKIARRTGWDNVTSAGFATAEAPYDSIKDFVNEAKDEIIDELGMQVSEEEFVLNTTALYDTGTVQGTAGNQYIQGTIGAGGYGAYTTYFTTDMEGRKIAIDSAGSAWYRIASVTLATQIVYLDATIRDTFTSSDYTIFEDEYDLDATAREVISAWTDDGPVSLDFRDEARHFDHRYPGDSSTGSPTDMALFRSTTSGYIWTAQFRPIPDLAYTIRYKARTRLADLSAHGDTWDIQPEIEAFIVDRALFKMLNSPVQNDPDLALTIRAVNRESIREHSERHADPTPMRRLRRRGPDEWPTRLRPRLDPVRFH
jgi:hypothetical protein